MIAIVYLSIALLFALLIIIAESSNDGGLLKKESHGVAISLLVLIWPLTLLLIVALEIFEFYKKKQAEKIVDILVRHNKGSIDACIPELSIEELRTLHHAYKIGATFLSPKSQELVKQSLIDKSFEKHFLEKNDGR